MRHTINLLLLVLLLITGNLVLAQTPAQPDETTTLSDHITQLKQEERAKKGKKLTRYEETDIEWKAEFLAAVKSGDVKTAAEKLKPQYFYAFDDGGETALTRSVKNGDLPMVRMLEENNVVINVDNERGETPLILAIKGGNNEIIDIIAERANPTLEDAAGMSPVMAALDQGNLELVKELIRKGADLNRKSNGKTPIFRAVEMNNLKAVALLAHHGADPSIANEDGDIPLYHAVRNGNNVMTGILLHKSKQASEDANWTNQDGDPILNLSIKADHDQITKMLLDFGADTQRTDYMENTALNLAAKQGDTELVQILLTRGADPNHRNIMGETPLITASRKGNSQTVNILAEAGADPAMKDFNGYAASDRHNFGELTDPEIVDAVMEVTNDYE